MQNFNTINWAVLELPVISSGSGMLFGIMPLDGHETLRFSKANGYGHPYNTETISPAGENIIFLFHWRIFSANDEPRWKSDKGFGHITVWGSI